MSEDNAAATAAGKSQDNQQTAETAEAENSSETGQAPTLEELQKQLKDANAAVSSAEKRISKLNKENADRRKQLKQYEDQERSKLSLEEQLETLQTDYDQSTQQFEQAQAQLEHANDVLKAQLEAQFKILSVPDYVKDAISSQPIPSQLQYLADHAEEFSSSKAGRDLDAGKGGKSPRVLTVEDFKGKSQKWINENWHLLEGQGK